MLFGCTALIVLCGFNYKAMIYSDRILLAWPSIAAVTLLGMWSAASAPEGSTRWLLALGAAAFLTVVLAIARTVAIPWSHYFPPEHAWEDFEIRAQAVVMGILSLPASAAIAALTGREP